MDSVVLAFRLYPSHCGRWNDNVEDIVSSFTHRESGLLTYTPSNVRNLSEASVVSNSSNVLSYTERGEESTYTGNSQ